MLPTAILVPICLRAERCEPLSIRLEELAEIRDVSAQSDRAEVDERFAEGRASRIYCHAAAELERQELADRRFAAAVDVLLRRERAAELAREAEPFRVRFEPCFHRAGERCEVRRRAEDHAVRVADERQVDVLDGKALGVGIAGRLHPFSDPVRCLLRRSCLGIVDDRKMFHEIESSSCGWRSSHALAYVHVAVTLPPRR